MKKFYQRVGGDCTKTYQQPDDKETKQFWGKIWQPREHNRKAKWINNLGKELERLKEGPKAKIFIDSLWVTLKKNTKLENSWLWWYIDTGLKKFTSIHDRLAIELNRCLQEVNLPEWMTKGKFGLVCLVLWHINLCRLFNAKSIFM